MKEKTIVLKTYLDGRQDIIGGNRLPSILSGKIIGTCSEINNEYTTRSGKGR